jgi:hypothetical protein
MNVGFGGWGGRQYFLKILVKKAEVKITLEQATKAQRGSRDIALLFL